MENLNLHNLPFKGKRPSIHPSAFIAPGATVAGDVEIGAGSNIWFQCALRGDVHFIKVGENTNIQDGSICHVTTAKFSLNIGSHVTVGHGAILHGCTLQDFSFVGMGATVMDGAVVETDAMVAAGALVTPGKVVKSGELWAGNPAKLMREVTPQEKEYIRWSALHYKALGETYVDELKGSAEK